MLYQSCFYAMGTRLQLILPEVEQQDGEFLQSLIVNRVEQLEQSLSLYRPDSAVSLLNETLSVSNTVSLDDQNLIDALRLAQEGHKYTNGFYNAACGEMIERVKNHRNAKPLACSFTLSNEQKLSVERIGTQFDFGGLGKGMAIDSIIEILAEQGVKNALISFGESSIYGLGHHPHGEHWPIAVPNPVEPNESIAEVNLFNCGATLSSTVANGANNGHIQHHIINPITAKVVNESVTTLVESDSMAWGEMLSTASLICGVEFTASYSPNEAGVKNVSVFKH
jgi:FAD:protein FMN transferase